MIDEMDKIMIVKLITIMIMIMIMMITFQESAPTNVTFLSVGERSSNCPTCSSTFVITSRRLRG